MTHDSKDTEVELFLHSKRGQAQIPIENQKNQVASVPDALV
jgi:hypothetical protein